MVAPGGRRGEQYRHKAQARFRRLMAALAALVGGRDEKWFRNCAQKTTTVVAISDKRHVLGH